MANYLGCTPIFKPSLTDVWTHKVERLSSKKFDHVAYKNGKEMLRVREEKDARSSDPTHPTRFQEDKLQLDYSESKYRSNRTFYPPEIQEPEAQFMTITYFGLTLKEMIKEHEIHQMKWNESKACKDLKKLIACIGDDLKYPITNIVYLAVGSFQRDLKGYSIERVHVQLAALNTIKKALKNSNEIECIAQDPSLSNVDKQFLGSHGFQVVNDPAGFAAINTRSLVYMICGPRELDTVISRGSWPAVYISNKPFGAISFNNGGRADMVHECQEMPFPGSDFDIGREDTTVDFHSAATIYWRKKSVFGPPRPLYLEKK